MTNSVRRLSFYNTAIATEHYLGIRWPRAIWQAVLEQAIEDAVDGPPAFELEGMAPEQADKVRSEIQTAAMDWISDSSNEPRRFAWVCEQLDLEPSAVRVAVARRRTGL